MENVLVFAGDIIIVFILFQLEIEFKLGFFVVSDSRTRQKLKSEPKESCLSVFYYTTADPNISIHYY